MTVISADSSGAKIEINHSTVEQFRKSVFLTTTALESLREWLSSPMSDGAPRALALWALGRHADAVTELEQIPQNALVVSKGDLNWNSLRYLQFCEGLRPDVDILDIDIEGLLVAQRQAIRARRAFQQANCNRAKPEKSIVVLREPTRETQTIAVECNLSAQRGTQDKEGQLNNTWHLALPGRI